MRVPRETAGARASAWVGRRALPAASASVLLVVVAVLSQFAADDWCAAAGIREHGLLAPVDLYASWSGRYTANVLVALVGSLGPALAWALPVVTLGGLVVALSRLSLPAAAVVAVALLIVASRAPAQDFLWPTGVASYLVGLVLVVVSRNRWPLVFLAAGTSETLGVALLVALTVGRAPRSMTLAAAGGLLVMALAPGNAVRADLLAHPDLWGVAAGGLLGVLAIAPFLLLALVAWIVTRERLILVGLAAAVASIVPAAILTGAPPPDRALLVPIAFLIGPVLWTVRGCRLPTVVPVAAVAAATVVLAQGAPSLGLSGPTVPWVADCIARAGG